MTVKQLVECVPNFSEGRRLDIVERIVAEIKTVKQVRMLDVESDADHNRSVVTFVGEPAAVEEAAFRAIRMAGELIDMTNHAGGHPRMGATDVVPFIPISHVTMDDCVQIARRLGERVGAELDIPIYLYEEAATRPERRNLAHVRRGEFEGIREEIGHIDARIPDFGPRRLGTAGATAIGARAALIAFNVYLESDDVEIAQSIARAIRESSGGLPCVKALGLLVDGRAQISMNLTNYQKTSVLAVVDHIRTEAASRGATVAESEVVGLIPREALLDAGLAALQLYRFESGQILEERITDDSADS